MIILGIETSCDETAVSVCRNGEILSNTVSSQLIHNSYGGVVPEIASREHEKLLNIVVDKSLSEAEILSLIHIYEPTRPERIGAALFGE